MHIDYYLDKAQHHQQAPDQHYTIAKQWSQGRTVYGGISAGMLYAAAKSYVEEGRLLRSMSTNFVGPLFCEEPFTITIEIVRSGKNITQAQARAIQNGKVSILSQLCFAQARPSNVCVVNTELHHLGTVNTNKILPFIKNVTPAFLQHFELSINKGGLPFMNSQDSHYHGWMRYKDSPSQLGETHLVSIIDVWPPTLLQMMKAPAPASTVSWQLEFIYPHNEILSSDWLAYKAHTRQASDGYGHTEATIWNAQGEVIALSRQTVAVFDE